MIHSSPALGPCGVHCSPLSLAGALLHHPVVPAKLTESLKVHTLELEIERHRASLPDLSGVIFVSVRLQSSISNTDH